MAETRSYLQLHFIVLLWGFTAILGLLIKLSYVEVVFYRTFMAVLALAVIMYFSKIPFYIHPRAIIKIILVGAIIAIHWLLFFGAARYSNASVSLVGLSTTTFWTALIEPVVRKRRISKLEIFFGLIIVAGLYVIYSDEFEYGLGLVMSIISALLASTFSIFNVGFVRKYNAVTINFYEMIGACLTTVPILIWAYAIDGTTMAWHSWSDFGYLLILSMVCTVYANSASINILKKLTAFASNLVLTWSQFTELY